MLDFDQQLKVWTLGQGQRARWRSRLETDDLDGALQEAARLAAKGEWPCVSELGAYQHEGKRVVGWVTFWWCPALNEEMDGAPEGRGRGWADEEDEFVSYDHPGTAGGPWGSAGRLVPSVRREVAFAEVMPPRREESAYEDDAFDHQPRYEEASCDDCGLILPMNALVRTDREVKSGRVSGTKRASISRGNGHTYTGASTTSGRSYYKTTQIMLCANCYERELARKRENRPLLVQIAEGLFNMWSKR